MSDITEVRELVERLRRERDEARAYQAAAAEGLAHELEMSEEYRLAATTLRAEVDRLRKRDAERIALLIRCTCGRRATVAEVLDMAQAEQSEP